MNAQRGFTGVLTATEDTYTFTSKHIDMMSIFGAQKVEWPNQGMITPRHIKAALNAVADDVGSGWLVAEVEFHSMTAISVQAKIALRDIYLPRPDNPDVRMSLMWLYAEVNKGLAPPSGKNPSMCESLHETTLKDGPPEKIRGDADWDRLWRWLNREGIVSHGRDYRWDVRIDKLWELL